MEATEDVCDCEKQDEMGRCIGKLSPLHEDQLLCAESLLLRYEGFWLW